MHATPFGGRPRVAPARVEALAAAVATLPAGVPVSTSNTVGAHVSDRRYVYTVPNIGRAQWIVVDLADPYVVTPDSPILSFHPKVPRAFAAEARAGSRLDEGARRGGSARLPEGTVNSQVASASDSAAQHSFEHAVDAVRKLRYSLIVFAAAGVWSVVMFMLMHDDFTSYRLGTFDLGSMVHAVWNTAHGRPLETTSLTGEQVNRLGGHVDPVLVLLAPLWVLVPSPLTLAGFQIVAVALGAFPVFWLARHHLGSRVAVTVAVAYLLYPWLAWSALDAIHPVTLAIPLLILCVWALDRDRLVLFAVRLA